MRNTWDSKPQYVYHSIFFLTQHILFTTQARDQAIGWPTAKVCFNFQRGSDFFSYLHFGLSSRVKSRQDMKLSFNVWYSVHFYCM